MNLIRAAMAILAIAGSVIAQSITTASAGSWGPIVAPDSIAAGFGANLSGQTYSATSLPLPTTLGTSNLSVTDSAKVSAAAGLYMVSSGQVNFLVPPTSALGAASLTYTNSGTNTAGTALVSNVSPAIFAANQDGKGAAVAQYLRVAANNTVTVSNTFAGSTGTYAPTPYSLSPAGDKVYLVLYATGLRRHSANPVRATIGGTAVPVLYAGQVSGFAGLDQVNIGPLPATLSGTGKGNVDVIVTVDGIPSNAVTINIQ